MAIKFDGFAFDRGIDRIIRNDQLGTTLPDASHLPPSEAASSAELDKLLALPNLQDYLAALLQPEVTDRSMLTPYGFQQALHAAIDTLRGQRRQHAASDAAAEPLDKALQLLDRESELRDLVSAYRSSLYPG